MKTKTISKSTMVLLVTGLLITSLVPLVSRYIAIPDLFKGIFTGTGLMLEFIALVQIRRIRNTGNCASTLSLWKVTK